MVFINSVIAIDLTGQFFAGSNGTRIIKGSGGLLDLF